MPAGFRPMSFGIYGGVGYFSGFPLIFVPYPAACPEHRAIEGHHSPTVRPRSYLSATRCLPRHPIWAGRVSGRALRRLSNVRREGNLPSWLSRTRSSCISRASVGPARSKQLRDGMQVAHDHYHQGFEEEPVRIYPWASGTTFGGRPRSRPMVEQFNERDKQAVLPYHRKGLHESF